MNRRSFINKTAKTLAATALPVILPTGSLFAATGTKKVNHVIFCLFAGGVRNIEALQMEEGNLLPYFLPGDKSIAKSIEPGMTTLPEMTGPPLLNWGTLFKEFRFAKGPTGHVSAHLTSLSGKYDDFGYNPKSRPHFPTIFEYYRKHAQLGNSALNAWWIANRSEPYLKFNYSTHRQYGKSFAGNFIQPANLIKTAEQDFFHEQKAFGHDQMASVDKIRKLFNDQHTDEQLIYGINNINDRAAVQEFILQNIELAGTPAYTDPWNTGVQHMNNDLYNIHYAMKVMEHFQPELLAVNMGDIDRCHTNFTMYCDNMRKASFGVSKMWEMIQSTEGLKDDTVLIIVPEFGRNLHPNTLRDAYGRLAIDHTNDATSREIFCMILGPKHVVKQNHVIEGLMGESIDLVPTIAHLLGFEEDLPFFLNGRALTEAFV